MLSVNDLESVRRHSVIAQLVDTPCMNGLGTRPAVNCDFFVNRKKDRRIEHDRAFLNGET
jgi:hypothetical protein